MNILLLFLSLLLLLVIKDYYYGYKIKIFAAMENHENHAIINFGFLFKMVIEITDEKPFLSIYILRFRVYKGRLVRNGDAYFKLRRLIKAANFSHLNLTASYGCDDPFYTSFIHGALSAISSYFHFDKINLKPNFISTENFAFVQASANLKVGQTMINFIKYK